MPWPISWAPILAWPRRCINCTPAMTDCCSSYKDALFHAHLVGRWRDLFNARFDVLLYDLTSPAILRSTPHSCRKATSAGMVTAVIIGRIVRRW